MLICMVFAFACLCYTVYLLKAEHPTVAPDRVHLGPSGGSGRAARGSERTVEGGRWLDSVGGNCPEQFHMRFFLASAKDLAISGPHWPRQPKWTFYIRMHVIHIDYRIRYIELTGNPRQAC